MAVKRGKAGRDNDKEAVEEEEGKIGKRKQRAKRNDETGTPTESSQLVIFRMNVLMVLSVEIT